MSALDLQQPFNKSSNNNSNDENDYDAENAFYYVPAASYSEDGDEPFFLGMRRESFGVGEHYHQTSQRFRTKRFRSKLELGMI
jgi:hypothetical protein